MNKLQKGPVVLYEQMKLKILELIRERGLQPHDPVPSEVELANMYGVSSRTSKEALLQLARDGVVYRLPRKGTFLSGSAADESKERHGLAQMPDKTFIAVLLPDMDEYVGAVLQSLSGELEKRGCEVVLRFTSGSTEKENEIIQSLMDRKLVSGIVVYPGSHEKLSEKLIQLHMNRFPVLIVDRAFREIDIPSVYHDHFQGSLDLTTYLIENGHQEIGYITEDYHGVMTREDRFNGFAQAFLNASLSWNLRLIHTVPSHRRLQPEDTMLLDKFLSEHRDMTAVVCSNDYVAMLAMQAANRLGISVPDKLSVVGFTDFSFVELLPVPLTTSQKTASELGQAAGAAIAELVRDPSAPHASRIIPTQLRIRDSVKRLNG